MEHFAELRSIIEARINPHAFYAEYIRGYVQGKLVLCPLHDDKNPSFKVYEDGGFKCFGCGRSGSGPVKFYELFKNCSFQEAQEELYSKYVEFTVPQRVIDATVERLKGRPEVLERLQKDMGWAQAVLERLEIGLHAEDDRITIQKPRRQ